MYGHRAALPGKGAVRLFPGVAELVQKMSEHQTTGEIAQEMVRGEIVWVLSVQDYAYSQLVDCIGVFSSRDAAAAVGRAHAWDIYSIAQVSLNAVGSLREEVFKTDAGLAREAAGDTMEARVAQARAEARAWNEKKIRR